MWCASISPSEAILIFLEIKGLVEEGDTGSSRWLVASIK